MVVNNIMVRVVPRVDVRTTASVVVRDLVSALTEKRSKK